MEVQFTPEMEAKLDQLAKETGRPQSEFVENALAVYLSELLPVRQMLDRRYDEMESGAVKPLSIEEVRSHFAEKSTTRRLGS